jgi:asparagine synthase (glutamine-hydrolysing)
MTPDGFYRMTPLEVASGWITGSEGPAVSESPDGVEGEHPLSALEKILRQALQRPPCVISFSGGRDSSALLAVAGHQAAREGLPHPIAVTNVYEGVPEADETAWQEMVIRHLGVRDWERIQVGDRMDLLGSLAKESIRRHGLLWPVTAHTKSLVLEKARGGTLITGEGGDELFGPHRITPIAALAARRVRPRRTAVRESLLALAPPPTRALVIRRRVRASHRRPWLRPLAQERFLDDIKRDAMAEPLWWDESVRALLFRRSFLIGKDTFDRIAEFHGARYLYPYLAPSFVSSFAEWGGKLGIPSRTAAMEALFGRILPMQLIRRKTKAEFVGAVFGPHCRDFVRSWRGDGIDAEMVDPEALRETWDGHRPHAGSLLLLQSAWHHSIDTTQSCVKKGACQEGKPLTG